MGSFVVPERRDLAGPRKFRAGGLMIPGRSSLQSISIHWAWKIVEYANPILLLEYVAP